MRRLVAAGAVAAALAATSPVTGQPAQPPSASLETALVGLPVYSSDGQKLGDVTQAVTAGSQPVVRANFGDILGSGPIAVIIPAALFVQKDDRIEVKMTAAEVKDRLAKQQQQQQQQQQQ
jgi:hypothetical protein